MATAVQGLARVAAPRRLYLCLGLLAVAIVVVGFWPTYLGPLLAGTVDRPTIIHFHAAVYVGWLGLFVTQTALAATGRVGAHTKLGRFAAGYGVLVVAAELLAAS